MVRLRDDVDRGTGDRQDSTASTSRDSRQQGRQLAVRSILEADETDTAVADGGLSPSAVAWMDATPGADVDDARTYDRETGQYRDVGLSGPLQPRGKPGSPSNYDRADVVNEARTALREYHDLAEQDDVGTD